MRIFAGDGKTEVLQSMLIDAETGAQTMGSAVLQEDFELAADLEAAAKFSDDDRRIPFVMFTDRPMRDGLVVHVAGYDLAPWGPNGMPFLDAHNYDKAPLGHMENVDKKATAKSGARAVRGEGVFSSDPLHVEAAVKFGLYRDGHMKAGSGGWQIRKWKFREFDKANVDPEDDPESYLMTPIEIMKSRGLEFSAVSVGRHIEALVTKGGLIAGASESQLEQALVEICRGVVGYNGGRRLRRDEVTRLVQATIRTIVSEAAKLDGNPDDEEPPAPPPQEPTTAAPTDVAREPLTCTHRYRNLDSKGLILMLRACPERVLEDFGITGGNRK